MSLTEYRKRKGGNSRPASMDSPNQQSQPSPHSHGPAYGSSSWNASSDPYWRSSSSSSSYAQNRDFARGQRTESLSPPPPPPPSHPQSSTSSRHLPPHHHQPSHHGQSLPHFSRGMRSSPPPPPPPGRGGHRAGDFSAGSSPGDDYGDRRLRQVSEWE